MNLRETPRGTDRVNTALEWGSDAVAHTLRDLNIEYVAVTPGSSFRGLHDSVVNALHNTRPQLIACLHEEHTVAIAHGYYKASGKVMAAAVHANVGLMHATMAIFSAWCDRVPVLVIGATGPFDAPKRRPWVDWLHTGIDLGALIRGYTKWDDKPASLEATLEALNRAHSIALTAPKGPVYVCMDIPMQETPLAAGYELPDLSRFPLPQAGVPSAEDVDTIVDLAEAARHIVLLVGRVSAGGADWENRVLLAESLGADVVSDLKTGARFPTGHQAHIAPPGLLMDPDAEKAVRNADLIISLDWVDLGGTLQQVFHGRAPSAKIVHCSPDQYIHGGFSMDYQSKPVADVSLLCEPDTLVRQMLNRVTAREPSASPQTTHAAPAPAAGPLGMEAFAATVTEGLAAHKVCLARLPIGWPGTACHFEEPLDYLGYDGSGAIGSGPGMCVGAALALKGTDRLAVGIIGDGDYLMGVTALWTAVSQKLPLLVIVANNCSFFNDELHQDRIAQTRNRDRSNRGVAVRIDNPAPDLAKLAEGQGAIGIGPVLDVECLKQAIAQGLEVVRAGGVAVIDARVVPEYARGIPESVLLEQEGTAL